MVGQCRTVELFEKFRRVVDTDLAAASIHAPVNVIEPNYSSRSSRFDSCKGCWWTTSAWRSVQYPRRDCAIIRRHPHPGIRQMELGQIGLKIDDLKGRCGALRGYL